MAGHVDCESATPSPMTPVLQTMTILALGLLADCLLYTPMIAIVGK